MDQKPYFKKGLELNREFYADIVKPLLKKGYPDLQYSASLLGYGSDVLGYDTETSMDHNWGPRLQLFIKDEKLIPELNNYFRNELPFEYKSFPVNFSSPAYDGVQRMERSDKKPVNHLIEIKIPEDYFKERYGIAKMENYANSDWLGFTDQNLLEITSGLVFHDGLNILNKMREELKFYPLDICKLRMAILWNYISNKEAFIGRCIATNDNIGLKINSCRIVNYLIKILFYLEKKYLPYSKWFGTGFRELAIYSEVSDAINSTLIENIPQKIEEKLCFLYEKVVEAHNKNDLLPPLENKARNYFNRPYKVIFAENIVKELVNSIHDEEMKKTDLRQYAHDIILDY